MIEKSDIRKMLVRAEKSRKAFLQPCFAEIGLPLGRGHARILEALLGEDHVTQKELSDRCHMDVTTMSRSLDHLEQAGFLERRREPGNRRSFLICLTPDGLQAAGASREILAALDARIWKGFSAEEMEQLYHSLERICQNLEND